MVNPLDQKYCKLIGLSCLKGEIGEQAKLEWEKCFFPNEAFWLDVTPGTSESSIAMQFANQIKAQQINTMTNVSVIAAVFMDLTHAPDEQDIRTMLAAPQRLANALGCNAPAVLVFGYLGIMAFADNIALLRDQASGVLGMMSEIQRTMQLYLVADAPLQSEDACHAWKAVAVWLDVLRRHSNPVGLLPQLQGVKGAPVGFLRYGEYDENLQKEITDRLNVLEKALGGSGEQALQQELSTAKKQIHQEVQSAYPVDGAFQPLHPGMQVSGFFARGCAGRGTNREFNAAQASTQAALKKTAANMQATIREAYRKQFNDAAQCLNGFFQRADIGIELERDLSKIKKCLMDTVIAYKEPDLPALQYSATGYSGTITQYLEKMRTAAAEQVWTDLIYAMIKVYTSRSQDSYEVRKGALLSEKTALEARLASLIQKQDLLRLAANGEPLPEASFYPTLGGGDMTRLVLCRERQDSVDCDNACAGGNTRVYYMDRQFAGIKTMDTAPIKALQVLMLDPSTHMDDLIK